MDLENRNRILFIFSFLCTILTTFPDQTYEIAQTTTLPSTSTDFICPDEFGYYPHPNDCSLYYVCVFGGSLLESCSGGLMYSNELQTCDWPRNVECINGQPILPINSPSNFPISSTSTSERPEIDIGIVGSLRSQNISSASTHFGKITRISGNQDDSELDRASSKSSSNVLLDDISQQQRLSRSYAGFQPNFKNYDISSSSIESSVPLGRRVKRQIYYGYGYPQQASSLSTMLSYDQFMNPNNPKDYEDYYYVDEEDEQLTISTTAQPLTTTTSTVLSSIEQRGHSIASSSQQYKDISKTLLNSTPTRKITITNGIDKSISSQLIPAQVPAFVQNQNNDYYEDSSDYINQRYAANISTDKVEQQPKEYEYYYDYEEPTQYIQTAPTTTTTTTTTTKAPQILRHHILQVPLRQQKGSSSKRTSKNRPKLPPANQILKGVSSSVRNIYADPPPSRPEPIYATPEPNSPATKCHRSNCVVPDCNCGGKYIPGGLDPSNTPQLVLLTFDDSVNDLNKNLYKDLFEVGRKNPNGCPISATFYVSHEWTDYSQVQNLAADGHELASHSVSHSFGEQFSTSKWLKEINGQREILAAYGGVKLSEIRGMRAPFLAIGGNNMFRMLYDANFTYDSSMPVYENNPPSWPYTLDYKIFHQCMIPPCPTKSFPGVWEVPMVMWQDLKGGRCSMGDACSNPPTAQGVYEMLVKNFERHYTTSRAPFGLYYHAAWFTKPHHKEGFESFLDVLSSMDDVWLVTNWQAIQWIRNPVGINEGVINFPPFDCKRPENKAVRPKRCNSPRVCNLWHKSGVRYMKTCQNCPEIYPWTGATGV